MLDRNYYVKISDEAYKRMYLHFKFLARASVNAADRLYNALDEALIFLEDNPKSCPVYNPKTPIDAELRFKMFYGRYRIIFEIIGDMVYGHDIQDCRQDVVNNLI